MWPVVIGVRRPNSCYGRPYSIWVAFLDVFYDNEFMGTFSYIVVLPFLWASLLSHNLCACLVNCDCDHGPKVEETAAYPCHEHLPERDGDKPAFPCESGNCGCAVSTERNTGEEYGALSARFVYEGWEAGEKRFNMRILVSAPWDVAGNADSIRGSPLIVYDLIVAPQILSDIHSRLQIWLI